MTAGEASTDEEGGESSSADSFLRAVAFSPRVAPPGAAQDRVGESLGRFEITGLLGRGGMGVVYEARDATLRRSVALKLLPEEAMEDEERRRRFLREARSAAAVSHPNIAAVFEVGEVGGEVFIAMERVEGRSLRAALLEQRAAGKAMDAAEAARIGREIARGLAAAHAAGVIHRDVKPENVMISRGGAVKLLDFGLAKLRGEGARAASAGAGADAGMGAAGAAPSELSTREGRILGTPSYMAPEQARGLPADARSDVFALGVVLYEMLAGERPFRGETAADVLAAILRDEAPRLGGRGVGDCVAAVVERCLEKEPARRYADAGELLAALEEAEAGAAAGAAAGASAAADADAGAGRRPRRRRAWAWLVLPALAGVAAAMAALPAWRAPSKVEEGAAAMATAPAPRPTAVTDQPLPTSGNPAAIAAYQAALQAFHDANWGRAELNLRDALKLDPGLAAAHLRLALIMSNLDYVSTEAQAAYAEATRLRGTLTPRDRALLGALEPLLVVDPANLSEAVRRLGEMAKTYPHDAEIFNLMAVYQRLGEPSLRLAAARRAVELDPEYADAWQQVGGALVDSDPAEAAAALERCTTIAPTAADCWTDRANLEGVMGRCATAEAFVRRATSDPRSSSYHRQVRAHLLYALGKPAEAVHEALRQKWNRLAPSSSPEEEELYDSALLAIGFGDFEAARAKAEEGLRRADAEPTLRFQARFALLLAEIELESGRVEAAAEVAMRYLKRRDAWQMGMPGEDPTVYLARVAARGGRLSAAEVRARRDAWYKAASAGGTPAQRAEAWALAYVVGVEEGAEAAEALEARPKEGRWSMMFPVADAALGQALWLGGTQEGRSEAMPYLARAHARCDGFAPVFVLMRARLLYGKALEERGERGIACEVYEAVRARWGGARSRSVTAEEAGRRAEALGCGG